MRMSEYELSNQQIQRKLIIVADNYNLSCWLSMGPCTLHGLHNDLQAKRRAEKAIVFGYSSLVIKEDRML